MKTSAFNLGRSKTTPEEKEDDQGNLLRGRNLNSFLEAIDYGLDSRTATGDTGGDGSAGGGMCRME